MPTQFKDYYAILGVSQKATPKEIHAAYRRLARKYHPDVNANDPKAIGRFQEINEAHEVLHDPEKRSRYDQLGANWQDYQGYGNAAPSGSVPFSSTTQHRTMTSEEFQHLFSEGNAPFSDFFYSVFGAPPSQPGQDFESSITISLEEAFTGAKKAISLSSEKSQRNLEVTIPPGIIDGMRIRLAGQGGSGTRGGHSGDLYIRVQILKHQVFTRQDDNLTCIVPVPLGTALLGGTVQITALSGKAIHLAIPPETQNGTRLRLVNKGMPHFKKTGNGDLYAIVDLRIPRPLTDQQRTAAQKFLEL